MIKKGDYVIIRNPGGKTDNLFGIIKHIVTKRSVAYVEVPNNHRNNLYCFKLNKLELLEGGENG